MSRRRRFGLLLIGALAWGVPGAARADVDDKTRNAARSLAEQGRELFDKGESERAYDLFHRAYGLVPAPTIALYEARALEKLGRLVQAQEAYLRAVRTQLAPDSPEAFRKAVREAEQEEVALQARIPRVTLLLRGPGAQAPGVKVTVDGEPLEPELIGVEMPINPGSHVVVAQSPGASPTTVSFALTERAKHHVEVRVEAAPTPARASVTAPALSTPPPPRVAPLEQGNRWQKPAAYAAGAVGIAGLATGIVTGVMAQSRYAAAKRGCPNRACVEGSAGAEDLSAFRSLRSVSTISYVVGGVGLAAGVSLFLLAPRAPQAATAALWLGPQGASVRGEF